MSDDDPERTESERKAEVSVIDYYERNRLWVHKPSTNEEFHRCQDEERGRGT